MKYGNRSPLKKIFSSPITLLILLVLFFILAKATWNIYEKANLSSSKLKTAEIELNNLKVHREELSKQINYLSTDQGIEAELRTKYRAIRDGESVAVIVDDQSAAVASSPTTTASTSESNKDGWLKKILRFFGF